MAKHAWIRGAAPRTECFDCPGSIYSMWVIGLVRLAGFTLVDQDSFNGVYPLDVHLASGVNGGFAGGSRVFTVSSGAPFTADHAYGHYLALSDPTNDGNSGLYAIRKFLSPTSVLLDFYAPAAFNPAASSGISWWLYNSGIHPLCYEHVTNDFTVLRSPHPSGWIIRLYGEDLHLCDDPNGEWIGWVVGADVYSTPESWNSVTHQEEPMGTRAVTRRRVTLGTSTLRLLTHPSYAGDERYPCAPNSMFMAATLDGSHLFTMVSAEQSKYGGGTTVYAESVPNIQLSAREHLLHQPITNWIGSHFTEPAPGGTWSGPVAAAVDEGLYTAVSGGDSPSGRARRVGPRKWPSSAFRVYEMDVYTLFANIGAPEFIMSPFWIGYPFYPEAKSADGYRRVLHEDTGSPDYLTIWPDLPGGTR